MDLEKYKKKAEGVGLCAGAVANYFMNAQHLHYCRDMKSADCQEVHKNIAGHMHDIDTRCFNSCGWLSEQRGTGKGGGKGGKQ